MKGLSRENTKLLNKNDLIQIKGALKRAYTKTGRLTELENRSGTFKGLEALINAWDTLGNFDHLMQLCFHIARSGSAILSEIMFKALVGIVDTAIKEIDAYEAYRGR